MEYDVTIIGCGIVGLSVGYHLKKERPGLQLAFIEKEKDIAKHQTGRNSGVIHSGIYYKPGSAKARNCKQGYDLLVQFCKEQEIHFEICGKLIVATDANEEKALDTIYERGVENGLKGLKTLNSEEIMAIEPYVRGTKGILVPQAGIVDYSQVAKKLKENLEEMGAHFFFGNALKEISGKEKLILSFGNNKIVSKYMVNCAGLYSDKIAKMNGVKLKAKIIPFKGEYFLIKENKRYLIKNLVYPVPDPKFPFLGVHFTRRINGEIDAGPNAVLALGREGYHKFEINFKELIESVFFKGFLRMALRYWKVGIYEMHRSFSKKAFVKSLQKLVPEIREEDLKVGNSGIRAQICYENGKLADDFLIQYSANAVHVVNAPSPAATSSLQIGKTICNKLISRI
ncbi:MULTISPECIES: L-2-hydroxyglutarate oxidase [Flagellimonas]|uniref:L-2-hydroxyglutarate oxidase n=1 Tax=Flagellimonas hadalis TaxID=2597517 RepID=A0A5N5IQA6_9FLAO|nr:L-2-hydroxyglutarate oxidase [Allomuricauda hadalis]KAB5488833.1 L-2-hydroxyglutarate oxidase [Allomuricauda hadalis]